MMKQENEKTKHPYFDKVKYDMETLGENLKLISAWKIEIEVITQKLNAYRDGRIPEILVQLSNKTVTLDDILASDEATINRLKSNIDHTNFKLNEYKPYLELLNKNEYEVINRKYLDIRNERTSYEEIAENMNCSSRTVGRWHDSAIEKIANYKHKYIEKIERHKSVAKTSQRWRANVT